MQHKSLSSEAKPPNKSEQYEYVRGDFNACMHAQQQQQQHEVLAVLQFVNDSKSAGPSCLPDLGPPLVKGEEGDEPGELQEEDEGQGDGAGDAEGGQAGHAAEDRHFRYFLKFFNEKMIFLGSFFYKVIIFIKKAHSQSN